jgi:Na+-driven multidrug efflux pump
MGFVGAAWSTVATELVLTLGCILALARLSHAAERSKPENVSKHSSLSAVLS